MNRPLLFSGDFRRLRSAQNVLVFYFFLYTPDAVCNTRVLYVNENEYTNDHISRKKNVAIREELWMSFKRITRIFINNTACVYRANNLRSTVHRFNTILINLQRIAKNF